MTCALPVLPLGKLPKRLEPQVKANCSLLCYISRCSVLVNNGEKIFTSQHLPRPAVHNEGLFLILTTEDFHDYCVVMEILVVHTLLCEFL